MDSTKKSLATKRGTFTRQIESCGLFLSNVESLDPSSLEMEMAEKIDKMFVKAETSFNALEDFLDSSSDALDEKTLTKEIVMLDEFSGNMSKLQERILIISSKIRTQVGRTIHPSLSSPTSSSIPSSKINIALRPDKLLSSCTLAEFRSWSTGFSLFYSSNHMNTFPLPEQQGYLRSCLELKLQQMLNTKIEDDTPIFGDDGCISRLRSIFVQHIPLLTRRYNFFRCDQQPGEKFSDWYLRLQLEGQEAELSNMVEDDLFILRLVTGTSDRRLREEFLRQANPTRDLLHRTAMAWESAHIVETSLSSSPRVPTIAAVSSYKKSKSGKDKSFPKPKPKDPINPDLLRGKCIGCGSQPHPIQDDCPARGKSCGKCNKLGHFASVCTGGRLWRDHSKFPSEPSSSFSSVNSRPINSSVIRVNHTKTRPTPTTSVEIHPHSGTPFHMVVLPDTGATETLISADLVKLYGIPINKSRSRSILAANKSKLKCHGVVDLTISHLGKYKTRLSAFVTPDIHDQILLSWHSMIDLGMLNPTFPFLPEDAPSSRLIEAIIPPDRGHHPA